jgi:polyphosphate kinase
LRFDNGGDRDVWIGSADMMHRNLDRRVEALVRICDDQARDHLCGVLDLALEPSTSCWELESDGCWTRRSADAAGKRLADFQDVLIRRHVQRSTESRSESRAS